MRDNGFVKRAMVIGGGIAGIQAAQIAAQRGHSVTLYEAKGELGGSWRIASQQPQKEIYRNLIDELTKKLKAAGGKIILNKEVTLSFVKHERPDAVIVAIGAKPIVPDILGVDGANVVQAVDSNAVSDSVFRYQGNRPSRRCALF